MTMKLLGFSLLAFGLLLAALPAQAQGSTTLQLEAHAEGGQFYFTKAGETAHNPTLEVPASTAITVTLTNKGGAEATTHNFCDSFTNQCSEYVNADGDTVTYTFTSGTASGQYWCLPHKGSGMAGTLKIAGTDDGNGGGENKSPGFELLGLALAGLGAALILRRK